MDAHKLQFLTITIAFHIFLLEVFNDSRIPMFVSPKMLMFLHGSLPWIHLLHSPDCIYCIIYLTGIARNWSKSCCTSKGQSDDFPLL
ncbi:uncharacterized protein IWZ02DRAFT_72295 [Phyllosticta citriasiana]|uniref:uncharacterized protein n=1 Tax=Phyllosticta citriasiana TaxID=595635 RepID=UPI0030FDE2F0